MSKISLTEHIQFFHIDKMTGLAWLVRADDSSKYSISSKECNQCLIERSWGGFHCWAKSFFAAVEAANQNFQSFSFRGNWELSFNNNRTGSLGKRILVTLYRTSSTISQKSCTSGHSQSICLSVPRQPGPQKLQWGCGDKMSCAHG